MIVSVPSSARGEDPVTGASTIDTPCASSEEAMRLVQLGPIVEQSTHSSPGIAPPTAPS